MIRQSWEAINFNGFESKLRYLLSLCPVLIPGSAMRTFHGGGRIKSSKNQPRAEALSSHTWQANSEVSLRRGVNGRNNDIAGLRNKYDFLVFY